MTKKVIQPTFFIKAWPKWFFVGNIATHCLLIHWPISVTLPWCVICKALFGNMSGVVVMVVTAVSPLHPWKSDQEFLPCARVALDCDPLSLINVSLPSRKLPAWAAHWKKCLCKWLFTVNNEISRVIKVTVEPWLQKLLLWFWLQNQSCYFTVLLQN